MLADNRAGVEVEWLFPSELESTQLLDDGSHDWAEGIKLLKVKANSIGAEVGGESQMEQLMSSVPLGLRNRWRIWKVLDLLDEE